MLSETVSKRVHKSRFNTFGEGNVSETFRYSDGGPVLAIDKLTVSSAVYFFLLSWLASKVVTIAAMYPSFVTYASAPL